ncbi:hypothetical protein C475_07961 [Halosimplex carlsbadense 2-9-1]|uniref:Uncharacterized protein n=1 Tax=Halosimplex carlsbadense 2-9-1 TaxID=797114 RepID=M0CW24_9EURY|nr:hypothetical protein [Halosimplex carlsbadense]ELZ26853.1 hypothetical protein C475_07961 [Halosimplex carlsbadense 2-9-1]
MEEAAAVRGAALEAVGDVEPDRLRERIRERLEDGSMAPGVLTVLSARAVAGGATDARSTDTDAVADRGAGVQLIYEGLRLTRSLSRDPPWEREDELTDGIPESEASGGSSGSDQRERTDGGDVAVTDAVASGPTARADADDADMDILVADVMVARGFYLLARTEAAGEAVAVVRSFGGDQTRRRTTGDDRLDANLEGDVFELAAVAGTTAAGGSVTESLRSHVGALGRTDGRLPLAESLFSDGTPAALAERI